jgi:hypothetical protein
MFIRVVNKTRSFKFRSRFPKYIKKKFHNPPRIGFELSIKKLKSLVSAMFVLIYVSTLPAHDMTTKTKEHTNERTKENEKRTGQNIAGSEAGRKNDVVNEFSLLNFPG